MDNVNFWELRLRSSITSKRYSPFRKGPQKLMWTVCHGSGSDEDICRWYGRVSGLFAWQAKQLIRKLSTSWSILGNQIIIISWSSSLVLAMPWCPSWAGDIVYWCGAPRMMMRVPHRMRSSVSFTVSSSRALQKNFNSATFTCTMLESSLIMAHLLYISSMSFWSVVSALVAC